MGLPIASPTAIGLTFAGFEELTSYNTNTGAELVTIKEADYPAEGRFEAGTITYNSEFDVTSMIGWGNGNPASKISYTPGRDAAGKLVFMDRAVDEGLGGGPLPRSTVSYKPNQQQVDTLVNDDGTHAFTYDSRGLAHTQVVAGEGTYTYDYDPLGRNTSLTFPDGHTRVQVWDHQGRLTSRCYQYSDPSKTRCYGASYDAVGNPRTLTDPEGTDTIGYDALDRVNMVTRTSPGHPDLLETYTYNALGALKTNAGVLLDDQRPKLAGGGTADAGVPANYGGQVVGLDANGRVTSLGAVSFGWNHRGWLQSVTSGGTTENYGHDAFGRLLSRQPTAPPHDFYVYDDLEGANIIGVRRWTGGAKVYQMVDNYLYDGVDHPLRLQHRATPGDAATTTVYYELDLAGNVRRLRGATGEDLGGYRYTAFGKLYAADGLTPAPALDQPLRWKGRPFNALGNVYDMRARQWSPDLGVFLQGDEFALLRMDATLWGWPGQNPLRYRDPSGRDAEEWFLRNAEWMQNAAAGVAFVAGTWATGGLLAEAGALGPGAVAGWASAEAGFQSAIGTARVLAAAITGMAPASQDPRVQGVLSQLYRQADRFAGGTAELLRREIEAGQDLTHLQKALDRIAQLEKLLQTCDLSPQDRALIEALINDLRNATWGR